MPKISIIVPMYNSEKYIKKCLESILNQTYEDFEVLLVNDGSTDKTESIVNRYNDKRIKYIKNKKSGIGKTRNLGIDKSKGEYLMFVDSDDYLDKSAVEKLYNKVEKDDLDIAICDYYKKIGKRIKEEKLISFENTSIKDDSELLLNLNLMPWNKIYKKSLIEKNKIRFPEDLKYENIMFVLDALMAAKKIGKVDESLYYFVIRNNAENVIMNEKVFDMLTICKEINKKYKKKHKDLMDKLTIKLLTELTLLNKKQYDKEQREKFINEVFDFLEKEIPDYKKNKYYKDRGIFNRTIGKSRKNTLIYCNLYQKLKKEGDKDE